VTKPRPGGRVGLARLPSVDRVLQSEAGRTLIGAHGRTAVRDAARAVLAAVRAGRSVPAGAADPAWIAARCAARLEARAAASLRPVFNLTGVVLHTNLGRALLPEAARAALDAAAAHPCNLEFDLSAGGRGERDEHVEGLLRELTGAEAATVVNNNAAAVFLLLNTLALRKEVIVSRGELIEIGGSFRMPDVMQRAGCRLREVGTTNRTHRHDYEGAIGARTGLLLKVHTSNYVVQGFTAAASERTLGALARSRRIPFAVDLGSGALVDLAKWGLPAEPTPRRSLECGAHLVTFSGDKLLGGPQAGMIVGERALIERIRRNPVRRALRLDKLRLAALEAVLKLHLRPEELARRLPTLRMLVRPLAEIEACAARLLPALRQALGSSAEASIRPSACQIGSGSLPMNTLPSACLALVPGQRRKGAGLKGLAAAFRGLPVPVIGRIERDALCLDLRCLEDEAGFLEQLPRLRP